MSDNSISFTSCGCGLIVLVINLLVGGWSVDVILSWFDKVIPFGWAMVIGLFAGEISIPVAVI